MAKPKLRSRVARGGAGRQSDGGHQVPVAAAGGLSEFWKGMLVGAFIVGLALYITGVGVGGGGVGGGGIIRPGGAETDPEAELVARRLLDTAEVMKRRFEPHKALARLEGQLRTAPALADVSGQRASRGQGCWTNWGGSATLLSPPHPP